MQNGTHSGVQYQKTTGAEYQNNSAKKNQTIDITQHTDEARERLNELDKVVRQAVTERPLMAVGGAILAGFVLGRIFRG